ADDADRLAGSEIEVEAVDDRAGRRGDSQPPELEERLAQFRPRSVRRSKIQSPTTFTDAAVTTSAIPRASAVHSLSNSTVRLSDSMRPQSAVPGPTPSPRNERAASETMLNANVRKAFATAIGSTFGQMCANMIRREGMPDTRAAST